MHLKRIILVLMALMIATPVHAFEDAIIAIVNDDIITLRDYKNFLNASVQQMTLEGYPRTAIQEKLAELEEDGLNRLIEEKLIINVANEIGMEIKEEAISRKVEEIRTRYPSEQDFLSALLQDGNTITDLRNKLREQLMVKYVIQLEVKDKITVNPQEITDFYAKYPEHFKRAERVNLDSIYIPYEDDKKGAFQKAQTIRQELADGADFKGMIEQHSKGPSLGVITKGQMLSVIEDAVFSLNVGEVSNPVETENGIYIFKVLGKIEADTAPLHEIREKIRNYLFQEKFLAEYTKWIEKVKNKAYVEIKE